MKFMAALLQAVVLLPLMMHTKLPELNDDERTSPVGVGEKAPDFTLEDQNKNKVTLSATTGKSPVVLVFYRGYW